MFSRSEIQQLKIKYQQEVTSQLVTSVIILNEQLVIQYANPAAEALLNKSIHKLIGLPFNAIFSNSSIDQIRLKQLLTSGQEFTESDILIELSKHIKFTAELTASSFDMAEDPHILLEFKQIDQQKQISLETFQQQQWEAARDLIKGLAHEIKNPLGGLRGAAQLLNKELNAEQQEYTALIIEQADRLTNLVDRLLGPNQIPHMARQNIHSILAKVCRLVDFNHRDKLNIKRDYDPSIPLVSCDQDQIQQVLLNIINNAIQAINSDNSITLKTRIASNKTIHNKMVKLCLQISIIDDGPGIPKHIQDTLFYPMVSGRSNGTGLGLSIAQTLVNQHQGQLSCYSRSGHTEFNILLPLAPELTTQQIKESSQ